MKNCLLVLALLLGILSAQAQDLQVVSRPDSAIKVTAVRSGRYSHVVYTINNEPITSATLTGILKRYPPSAAELHIEKKRQRLAILLVPVCLAGIIVGGTQADKHKYESGSAFSKAPVPFSIGLGAFVGISALLLGGDHYGKAVEAYNRQFH